MRLEPDLEPERTVNCSRAERPTWCELAAGAAESSELVPQQNNLWRFRDARLHSEQADRPPYCGPAVPLAAGLDGLTAQREHPPWSWGARLRSKLSLVVSAAALLRLAAQLGCETAAAWLLDKLSARNRPARVKVCGLLPGAACLAESQSSTAARVSQPDECLGSWVVRCSLPRRPVGVGSPGDGRPLSAPPLEL